MEKIHRRIILQNIHKLIQIRNLKDVSDKLIDWGIYNQSLIDELVGDSSTTTTTHKRKAQRLFLDYPSRGPKAFENLIEILQTTDNQDLALKLLNDSLLDTLKQQKENATIRSKLTQEVEDEVDSSQGPFDETLIVQRCESVKQGRASESESEFHKVRIIPATQLYNGLSDLSQCYKMRSNPRGLALIVNNIEFQGDPLSIRLGAEEDSENLRRLLEQIGYEVIVEINITKQALLDRDNGILTKFISRLSSAGEDFDSCLISLNSHGFNKDWIKMSDCPRGDAKSTAVSFYKDIMPRFNNRQFSAFQGKPKIFLLNACRGIKFNLAVPLSNPNGLLERSIMQCDGNNQIISPSMVGSYSDLLILRSTIPEYVSLRDIVKGTWFIQCICEAFYKHAHNQDFIGLKRKVNELMEERIDEQSKDKQSCHYEEVGSTKILYFNPGL